MNFSWFSIGKPPHTLQFKSAKLNIFSELQRLYITLKILHKLPPQILLLGLLCKDMKILVLVLESSSPFECS